MAVSWTQSSGDIAATWSSSLGDIAATWTQSSGDLAANWDTTASMEYGFIFWEGVEDKYEDVVSDYYDGIYASSGKWEDLG